MGAAFFHKDYKSNLYTDPVVVYKQRNLGVSLTPPKKGDAFPTPGRRQCTHKYIMVWDVLGISRVLGSERVQRVCPSRQFVKVVETKIGDKICVRDSLAEIVEVEIEVVSPSIVPSGSFTELKSHCHLYGAQGQRQAYLLPLPR
ncbi:hypothetical protein TNCV_6311 [Trichonephila clavipes]|nr:hypothetical protein TNCV_6311 [Trichonephila clavipes]